MYKNKNKNTYLSLAVWLLLVLLTSSIGLTQSQKKKLSLDDAFSIKAVADPKISPDGSCIVFVVTENNVAENKSNSDLWMVDIKGGKPLRLTYHEKDDFGPQWSPDGRYIAFISTRGGKSEVWLMDSRGGEPRRLTNHKAGVQSFKWSPFGKVIAFIAMEPQSKEEAEKQEKGDDKKVWGEYNRFAHLWLQKIDQQKAEQITKGKFFVQDFAWSPQGQIAYLSGPGPGEETLVHPSLTITGANGELVRNIDIEPGWWYAPSWSPDGRNISLMSFYAGWRIEGPKIYLISSDGREVKNLMADCEADVSDYSWLDKDNIIFSVSHGVKGPIFIINNISGKVKRFCDGDFVVNSFSVNPKTSGMAFLKTDATHPLDVYYTSLKKFDPVKLSDMNPQLVEFELATTEAIRWKGADDWPIEGLLIKPVGYKPGKAYPTISMVHGGPAYAWDFAFKPSWQYLAAQGYAILAPNPRGGTGYGQKFVEVNFEELASKVFQDIMEGMDYVIKEGISDPDKLALYGYSFGGYMTAWIVTHTNRYKAAMLGAGLTNLTSFYAQCDLQTVWDKAHIGATPWDDPQLYQQISPITYVKQVKTPTLIMYGANDIRVPPAQGQEFYIALKKIGIPVQFVTYPREGHGMRELQHRRDFLERTLRWYNKYALGKE